MNDLPKTSYSEGKKLPVGIRVSGEDILVDGSGHAIGLEEQHKYEKLLVQEERRIFNTGATRDKEETKLDFEGFLSPRVIQVFAEYMHKHRQMADGSARLADNWQKGIPLDSYMKSGWRHFFDWWAEHRGLYSRDGLTDALCGLLFNVMGYLHEHLKEKEKNENI